MLEPKSKSKPAAELELELEAAPKAEAEAEAEAERERGPPVRRHNSNIELFSQDYLSTAPHRRHRRNRIMEGREILEELIVS